MKQKNYGNEERIYLSKHGRDGIKGRNINDGLWGKRF